MKSSKFDISAINIISENHHNLSNILSAVVLTLDICDSVKDLSPEDFVLIKEELARAMQILRGNQQILGRFIEKNTKDETAEDDLTKSDAAFETDW